MRLKSSIWVAAYLRRCQTEGIFGAVRKRGAEEAGAEFVKGALLARVDVRRCKARGDISHASPPWSSRATPPASPARIVRSAGRKAVTAGRRFARRSRIPD